MKKEGWRIPAADHFTLVDKPQVIMIDGIEVHRKTVQSSTEDEPLVDVDGNDVEIEAVTEEARLFAVREVTSYEAQQRLFAYAVRLVPVAIENGARAYAGAMYRLHYYDEDGDGSFETRYSALQSPKLPQWLKYTTK